MANLEYVQVHGKLHTQQEMYKMQLLTIPCTKT